MMIYAAYILTASLVVLLSKKASDYIDLIEKTTKLSGAFLGGILLSAVTSLPELFTSISAVVLIGKPELCMGNILGSDIFNLAMLAFLIPFYIKGFSEARLSEGHNYILYFLIVIYAVMGLNMLGVVRFAIFGINITTLLILALYAASVRFLAAENGEQQAPDGEVTNLSTRQITARFIAASIGIVLLSIAMTYITDEIAARLNLGAGLAGAIFLGVATSLPEVSSTIALFRIKSYNIAVGNIVGSNIFNLLVLCIADLISFGRGVYDFSDPKVVNLLVFGGAATVIFIPILKSRNSAVKIACCVIAVACYVAFLAVK